MFCELFCLICGFNGIFDHFHWIPWCGSEVVFDDLNPEINRGGTWIGNGIVRRGSIFVPFSFVMG